MSFAHNSRQHPGKESFSTSSHTPVGAGLAARAFQFYGMQCFESVVKGFNICPSTQKTLSRKMTVFLQIQSTTRHPPTEKTQS